MFKTNSCLILTLTVTFLLAACNSVSDSEREAICRTVQPEEILSCLNNPKRKIYKDIERERKERQDTILNS
ncbi:MAG: hypothetical protein ACJAZB_000940 [Psychrosphaera sp.]|jgi:hypothetical protein